MTAVKVKSGFMQNKKDKEYFKGDLNGLFQDSSCNSRIFSKFILPNASMGGNCTRDWSINHRLSYGYVSNNYTLDRGGAISGNGC